jgi:c-di-GMP-binding flagellar brake protein YcgR
VTRDISAGGVRMARTGAAGEQAEALSVVLSSPAAGLRIETHAEVVRRSQRDLSLRFTQIADADVALLTQITVAYYRLAR